MDDIIDVVLVYDCHWWLKQKQRKTIFNQTLRSHSDPNRIVPGYDRISYNHRFSEKYTLKLKSTLYKFAFLTDIVLEFLEQ